MLDEETGNPHQVEWTVEDPNWIESGATQWTKSGIAATKSDAISATLNIIVADLQEQLDWDWECLHNSIEDTDYTIAEAGSSFTPTGVWVAFNKDRKLDGEFIRVVERETVESWLSTTANQGQTASDYDLLINIGTEWSYGIKFKENVQHV